MPQCQCTHSRALLAPTFTMHSHLWVCVVCTCVHVWVLAVVLAGDIAVGKSMLIHRFVLRDFMLASSMTIGVEVSSKAVTVGNTKVKALIWDTGTATGWNALRPPVR